MQIKSEFFSSLSKYTSADVTERNWKEIEKAYSSRNRFYHTLTHLESMVNILSPVRNQFMNWDVIVFAIAYHDIVYNALRSDNEEKSAQVAVGRMKEINAPKDQIVFCEELILATKKHLTAGNEVNFFTDADLSVLGAEREKYRSYSENVRKEYSIFPDLIYNAGRKKVLMHFLGMQRIFKTEFFFDQFEEPARRNLEWELDSLK